MMIWAEDHDIRFVVRTIMRAAERADVVGLRVGMPFTSSSSIAAYLAFERINLLQLLSDSRVSNER